jgi:hypothetical protein
MWWLLGLGVIAGAAGFWFGWRNMRRNRMAMTGDDALLAWDEVPLSAWQQDRAAGLFLTVHGGSVLTLAILALFEAGRFAAGDGPDLLAAIAVALASWLIGGVLAFPVAGRLIRPVPMRLQATGPVHGQLALGWADFSHYTLDRAVIRLYSAKTPGIARTAWRPPDQATLATAVGIVAQYVPSTKPAGDVPWYRRPATFIALGLVVSLPAVILGLALFALGTGWGWLYEAAAAILVFFLGAVIIGWYDVG